MRKPVYRRVDLKSNNDIYEGQSIERYVEEKLMSKQPIEGGAPIIFTARKDGVIPETDIRTDKMAIAQQAMGKVSQSYREKRSRYLSGLENNNNDETKETNNEVA